MHDEMTMSVSPICLKNNRKFAYVRFIDGEKSCEFMIPEGKLTKNNGFSKEETGGLQLYVKTNMAELKRMAAGINLFEVFKNS